MTEDFPLDETLSYVQKRVSAARKTYYIEDILYLIDWHAYLKDNTRLIFENWQNRYGRPVLVDRNSKHINILDERSVNLKIFRNEIIKTDSITYILSLVSRLQTVQIRRLVSSTAPIMLSMNGELLDFTKYKKLRDVANTKDFRNN
jgi:hypothetical protein